MLLGVHLCGTLSLRCVELFNDCPAFFSLALKPCCLPDIFFALRGDVFASANGHTFPAASVCAAGKWQRGNWVGAAGKLELERKYETWVENLSRCVDCSNSETPDDDGDGGDGDGDAVGSSSGSGGPGGGGVAVECHPVHPVLGRFIFASRRWSAEQPRHASSNDCGVSEERRLALLAEWERSRRQEKRERRGAKRSDGERAEDERRRRARETTLQVKIDPHDSPQLGVRLHFTIQIHQGTFIDL
jgi:hypothetical protein